MSMNISFTFNEWLWICFSFCFNYQPLLSTSEVSIKTGKTLPIQPRREKACDQADTSAALAIFLGTPLLSGRGREAHLQTWQTEMDGDRFLSCQHICSEASLLFLHFNKSLFRKDTTSLSYWDAERRWAHLQDDLLPINLHNLTFVPSPWHPGLVANTSVWCADVHIKTE